MVEWLVGNSQYIGFVLGFIFVFLEIKENAWLWPIGILAAINYYKEGFVKWEYAIVIAFTFVIGGYLGSKLSLSLPPQMVRRIFGVIMLLGAIKLISSK